MIPTMDSHRRVKVDFCYSITPKDLQDRFPDLESLKVKSIGYNGLFQPLPPEWGGFAAPWVSHMDGFKKLHSFSLKNMNVTDHDLEILANLKNDSLKCLKLLGCVGFSTKGLENIATACRNLETFSLRGSHIDTQNAQYPDTWFHILATTNANSLKTLDLDASWSYDDYASLNIRYTDIELLARKCQLENLVLQDIKTSNIVKLFGIAKHLKVFEGGNKGYRTPATTDSFPPFLQKIGLYFMWPMDSVLYNPIANNLKSLEATQFFMHGEDIIDMLEICPNLEELKTHNGIGDEGLITLSNHCKKLIKLVIVELHDDRTSLITADGLIALAGGCNLLEKLSVFVDGISNRALASIGRLVHLRYFRLVMLYKSNTTPRNFSLDGGIKSLLMGCRNLTRFDLHLGRGGLTDIGLGYIGKYGHELTRLLLGYVGGTGKGLLALAKGCPKLQKLAMRGNKEQYGWSELSEVAKKTSLNYIWLQGFFDSLTNDEFVTMAKDHWNLDESVHVEIFFATNPLDTAKHRSYEDLYGESEDQSKWKYSNHLLAYKSISTEARCDYDDTANVVPIYPPPRK